MMLLSLGGEFATEPDLRIDESLRVWIVRLAINSAMGGVLLLYVGACASQPQWMLSQDAYEVCNAPMT